MSKILELVQDNKGRLSSSKTGYLLAILVLLGIAVHMEINDETNSEIIGIIAAMVAGTHLGNRYAESSVERTEALNPPFIGDNLNDQIPNRSER